MFFLIFFIINLSNYIKMKSLAHYCTTLASVALLLLFMTTVGCNSETPEIFDDEKNLEILKKSSAGVYEFDAPVYDIASTPNGDILVGLNSSDSKNIMVIKNGEISMMTKIDAATNIQGIAAIGTGTAFVSTAGTDLAQNGELYRATYGRSKMIADLAAFERENDPDAFGGIQWKDQQCEAIDGFSAGPQNNPYHVAALSGNTALVADAAGNSILSATTTGSIDWKAVLTPPLNSDGEFKVRFNSAGAEGEILCYVQPVPTSVAVGPDGYVYVGELTGALSETDGVFPIGLSRVWKLPASSTNVTCSAKDPYGECELLIDGLTSIIDIEIGPNGLLYVVEFDESSWFAAFIPALASGGTITAYDLEGNFVETVASNLSFPSAITFDKRGNLWLLENNNVLGKNPMVRMLE